jgi:hypothetical protein
MTDAGNYGKGDPAQQLSDHEWRRQSRLAWFRMLEKFADMIMQRSDLRDQLAARYEYVEGPFDSRNQGRGARHAARRINRPESSPTSLARQSEAGASK